MFSGHRSSTVQTEMGLNRTGVAWFHHTHHSQASHDSSHSEVSSNRTSLRLGRHPKRLRDRAEDMVDVIDIEDEDHSFAAFFIGMKNGETCRNVKRPLVFTIKASEIPLFKARLHIPFVTPMDPTLASLPLPVSECVFCNAW
jgi:hypothetical protein